MTPSDTPRTDVMSGAYVDDDGSVSCAAFVDVEFARALERELRHANDALAAMTAERDGYAAECARLGGVVRAVSEDASA